MGSALPLFDRRLLFARALRRCRSSSAFGRPAAAIQRERLCGQRPCFCRKGGLPLDDNLSGGLELEGTMRPTKSQQAKVGGGSRLRLRAKDGADRDAGSRCDANVSGVFRPDAAADSCTSCATENSAWATSLTALHGSAAAHLPALGLPAEGRIWSRSAKSGLWSHYSLTPAKTPFHRKLLECLGKCFGEVPELQADLARAEKNQEIWRLLPEVVNNCASWRQQWARS